MIEVQGWILILLALVNCSFVVLGSIYFLRLWPAIKLGRRWIAAAGSYETAALELKNYELSIDLMIEQCIKGMKGTKV